MWKGKLLEIPTDIDIYAMYYNKDMFDKNHIPYPDETWDWNKYLEVAKKLTQDTDGDGKIDQWGTTLDMWWQDYVYANGGTIVGNDPKTGDVVCTLDQPAAYEDRSSWRDLMNKYHVAPTRRGIREPGHEQAVHHRQDRDEHIGKLGGGADLQERDQDVQIRRRADTQGAQSAGLDHLRRGVRDPDRVRTHKEAAWELVKFMTGKEYQRVRRDALADHP